MKDKLQKGFTLIEILVAATIISVLAAIAISSYTSANKSSRDARRKTDLENVRTALELYKSTNGYYPSTGSGSWTNLSNLSGVLVSTYLEAIPSDPKTTTTTPYRYRATNLSGANYYGYCLAAVFEILTTSTSCTPETSYTYSVKNP